jgi:hypothetical protein
MSPRPRAAASAAAPARVTVLPRSFACDAAAPIVTAASSATMPSCARRSCISPAAAAHHRLVLCRLLLLGEDLGAHLSLDHVQQAAGRNRVNGDLACEQLLVPAESVAALQQPHQAEGDRLGAVADPPWVVQVADGLLLLISQLLLHRVRRLHRASRGHGQKRTGSVGPTGAGGPGRWICYAASGCGPSSTRCLRRSNLAGSYKRQSSIAMIASI